MTTQAAKLGLKAGQRVSLVNAEGWTFEDPPDLEVVTTGPADLVIAFVRSAAELAADGMLAELAQRVFPGGALWIAWPRRAAGHVSDVTDNAVRAAALPLGVVDVKVAAIDEDWSGLKLMWRRAKRSAG